MSYSTFYVSHRITYFLDNHNIDKTQKTLPAISSANQTLPEDQRLDQSGSYKDLFYKASQKFVSDMSEVSTKSLIKILLCSSEYLAVKELFEKASDSSELAHRITEQEIPLSDLLLFTQSLLSKTNNAGFAESDGFNLIFDHWEKALLDGKSDGLMQRASAADTPNSEKMRLLEEAKNYRLSCYDYLKLGWLVAEFSKDVHNQEKYGRFWRSLARNVNKRFVSKKMLFAANETAKVEFFTKIAPEGSEQEESSKKEEGSSDETSAKKEEMKLKDEDGVKKEEEGVKKEENRSRSRNRSRSGGSRERADKKDSKVSQHSTFPVLAPVKSEKDEDTPRGREAIPREREPIDRFGGGRRGGYGGRVTGRGAQFNRSNMSRATEAEQRRKEREAEREKFVPYLRKMLENYPKEIKDRIGDRKLEYLIGIYESSILGYGIFDYVFSYMESLIPGIKRIWKCPKVYRN
jgi:hypothetical protein